MDIIKKFLYKMFNEDGTIRTPCSCDGVSPCEHAKEESE